MPAPKKKKQKEPEPEPKLKKKKDKKEKEKEGAQDNEEPPKKGKVLAPKVCLRGTCVPAFCTPLFQQPGQPQRGLLIPRAQGHQGGPRWAHQTSKVLAVRFQSPQSG